MARILARPGPSGNDHCTNVPDGLEEEKMRQTRALGVALAGMLAACGGGGGSSTPTTPTTPLIAVAGDYTTAVALTENTCGQVTVAALLTRVEHVPGARQLRLSHGVTYTGTVARRLHHERRASPTRWWQT